MMDTVGVCSARAALAGNPSDGYGGFVVAVPIPTVCARVVARPGNHFEIGHGTGVLRFEAFDELIEHFDRHGGDEAAGLVMATMRALVRSHAAVIAPQRIDVSTDIPRSVGLAGSSAIVIATLRALARSDPNAAWAIELSADPESMARLALRVETEELGIAAGLQDRLVQCHDHAVAMDFTDHTTLGLDEVPGRCVVAYRTRAAEPSGVVHASLRDDFQADVGNTRSAMAAIAAAGRSAASAIVAHDVGALIDAMNRTLELRSGLLTLDPALLMAAEEVRQAGGGANWTGSGGAIVALLPDGVDAAPLEHALVHHHGCGLIPL